MRVDEKLSKNAYRIPVEFEQYIDTVRANKGTYKRETVEKALLYALKNKEKWDK